MISLISQPYLPSSHLVASRLELLMQVVPGINIIIVAILLAKECQMTAGRTAVPIITSAQLKTVRSHLFILEKHSRRLSLTIKTSIIPCTPVNFREKPMSTSEVRNVHQAMHNHIPIFCEMWWKWSQESRTHEEQYHLWSHKNNHGSSILASMTLNSASVPSIGRRCKNRQDDIRTLRTVL